MKDLYLYCSKFKHYYKTENASEIQNSECEKLNCKNCKELKQVWVEEDN